MIDKSHILDERIKEALSAGILKPLLDGVRCDRDLILEFRGSYATIYCKGHRLDIKPSGSGYLIKADEAFLQAESLKMRSPTVQSSENATAFVKEELPLIKQAIAAHRRLNRDSGTAQGSELEFEQALIRANNLEPRLNTDYFAVDRQAYLGGSGRDRIDVLGVHWPCGSHATDTEVSLALIEVKFGTSGGVGDVAKQVERYYEILRANIAAVAGEAEGLLHQKLDLGLISGASRPALEKLKGLHVSKELKRVKIAIVLVDYSPKAEQEDHMQKLRTLRFADQIAVFHLGFGMWDKNAEPVSEVGRSPV